MGADGGWGEKGVPGRGSPLGKAGGTWGTLVGIAGGMVMPAGKAHSQPVLVLCICWDPLDR